MQELRRRAGVARPARVVALRLLRGSRAALPGLMFRCCGRVTAAAVSEDSSVADAAQAASTRGIWRTRRWWRRRRRRRRRYPSCHRATRSSAFHPSATTGVRAGSGATCSPSECTFMAIRCRCRTRGCSLTGPQSRCRRQRRRCRRLMPPARLWAADCERVRRCLWPSEAAPTRMRQNMPPSRAATARAPQPRWPRAWRPPFL